MDLLTLGIWVAGDLQRTPNNPSITAGDLACFHELIETDSKLWDVIVSHLIDLIAEFLVCRGHTSIIDHPGLLVEKAGAFTVIANGHNEAIGEVPGYSFSILFNGHPFAVMSATGEGSMGTGLIANPDSFRGALNEEMRKARVQPRLTKIQARTFYK